MRYGGGGWFRPGDMWPGNNKTSSWVKEGIESSTPGLNKILDGGENKAKAVGRWVGGSEEVEGEDDG